MTETIVVVRPSLPLLVAAVLLKLAEDILGYIPNWLALVLCTEDLWKGYR